MSMEKPRFPPIRPSEDYNPAMGLSSVNETCHGLETIQEHAAYYGLNPDEPMIFFITPTYYRDTQMVDLTRLSNTLHNDKNIYWVIIEDAESPSARVYDLLLRTGLPFCHLAQPHAPKGDPPSLAKNRGLDVVESLHYSPGIVFFGDDDNGYDLRLFDQIRQTKRVAMSGVIFAGGWYERCEAGPDGKVQRFYTGWRGGRKFPMDMAGFAFTTAVLEEKKPRFSPSTKMGYQETFFIEQLADENEEIEALDDCKNMYVWHVATNTRVDPGRVNVPSENDPDLDQFSPGFR